MRKAQFISNVAISGVPGFGVDDAEIAVYYDPSSNGIFGLDATFIDQVSAVVMNPMAAQPEFLLLSESDANGGDSSVDEESLLEFKEMMGQQPVIQMLGIMQAIHELNTQPDADGGWTGTGLQRKCAELGIDEAQFRTAAALGSVLMSELEEL